MFQSAILDMKELSLHILDILQNSVKANASRIRLTITEDLPRNVFAITIVDNGGGMNKELLARVTNPFATTRTTRRVGLGLALFQAAAEQCNGSLTIQSEEGKGTTVTAVFEHNHIDRMPLGDIVGTIITFLIGSPAIDFGYRYWVNGKCFEFETAAVKAELGDFPLSDVNVVNFLTEYLQTQLTNLADLKNSPPGPLS